MNWLQVSFTLQSCDIEICEAVLFELGALSISLLDEQDQPILEPEPGTHPLWELTRLLVLFEPDCDTKLLLARLCESLPQLDKNLIQIKTLEDQDWERVWLRDFRPMSFGLGLWVIPDTYTPPEPDAINLFLDPGLAFGTGTHDTTAMCLRWLASHYTTRFKAESVVLDFGCGSGILAIAAAKLGATQVFAHDIDPQALQATTANAEKNQVSDQITLTDPTTKRIPPIDLLMANILAKPLLALRETFVSLVQSGSTLILSGILREQAEEVVESYQSSFAVKIADQSGDWCLLECRRP